MKNAMASSVSTANGSHNQIGQKLGRKGRETRERILHAMLRLLADSEGPPVTLTSVAKEASIRLTNLYLYFPDLGDLLLAALARVMDTAEAAYLEMLRERWPNAQLDEACLAFLTAHHDFWKRNARILHMRNALADAGDLRVLQYRNVATVPLINLLAAQMNGFPDERDIHVATVLLTAVERVATVTTNPHYAIILGAADKGDPGEYVLALIEAEAEVLALAIRNRRSLAR